MKNLQQSGLEQGTHAPPFSLPDDAEHSTISDDLFHEHGLILSFVHGTWCPACVQSLYRFRQYAHIYHNEGFGVAVIANEAPGTLRVFRLSAQPPVTFDLLADEDGDVSALYKLSQTGAYYIIDQRKVVREKFMDVGHQGWPGHSRILANIQAIRSSIEDKTE